METKKKIGWVLIGLAVLIVVGGLYVCQTSLYCIPGAICPTEPYSITCLFWDILIAVIIGTIGTVLIKRK